MHVKLEPGKLYYDHSEKRYFTVISGISYVKTDQDDEKIYYGVAAADLDGNLSETFTKPILKVEETKGIPVLDAETSEIGTGIATLPTRYIVPCGALRESSVLVPFLFLSALTSGLLRAFLLRRHLE